MCVCVHLPATEASSVITCVSLWDLDLPSLDPCQGSVDRDYLKGRNSGKIVCSLLLYMVVI